MLEYSKLILEKVSFDPELFKKELGKCIDWVGKYDQKVLLLWCVAKFGNEYRDVILDSFVKHYL